MQCVCRRGVECLELTENARGIPAKLVQMLDYHGIVHPRIGMIWATGPPGGGKESATLRTRQVPGMRDLGFEMVKVGCMHASLVKVPNCISSRFWALF